MEKSIKKLIVALFVLYLASAISNSIMSVIQTNVIRDYNLVSIQQSYMDLATRIGTIAALCSIPFLQSKVKRMFMICFGTAAMIVNMCFIGMSSSFIILLLALVLISIGSCFQDSFVNALIIDLSGNESTKYVNTLHMVFGVGAMVNPFIINRIRDFTGWKSTYLVIAVFLFIALMIFMVFSKKTMTHPVMKAQKGLRITKKDAVLILRDKRNILTALACTFYTSYQMSIANWIITYLTLECSIPQDRAVAANSFLWIGIVLSRFTIPRIKRDPIKTFVTGSFISAPLCMFGILSGNFYIICSMTFVCGFLCGHGIPTLIARAGQNNPGRAVLGISINNLIGSVVGLVWSPVIASLQGIFNYRIALLVPGLLLLVSAFFGILLLKACSQFDLEHACNEI